MKVIIIDDEPKAREVLKKMLSRIDASINLLGEANSVENGVKLLVNNKPDILFLDIRMEDGTGFELLDKLDSIEFNVVFVTAYEEFSITAFKYNAIDYLLKPIILEDLKKVLLKAKRSESSGFVNMEQIRRMIFEEIKKQSSKNQITITNKTSLDIVNIEDIIRCEACSNYTYVHLSNDSKILTTKTLKEMEGQLSEFNFIRIHNSHLINSSYIKNYEREGFITLDNGATFPVSRRKKATLYEWFLKK